MENISNESSEDFERLIKSIADKLKQMRIDAGFSSYENFAWKYEIGRMQYWKMEKGTNFTMKSLIKVLNAHNMSLKSFFQDFE